MADYRILVTGSRTWKDYRAVRAALSAIADEARRAGHTGLIVVAGAAPYGADHDAMQWAVIEGYGDTGLRITYEPHPADWQPAQRGKPDLSAGYRRNADMVTLGAVLREAEASRIARGQPLRRPRREGRDTGTKVHRCLSPGEPRPAWSASWSATPALTAAPFPARNAAPAAGSVPGILTRRGSTPPRTRANCRSWTDDADA